MYHNVADLFMQVPLKLRARQAAGGSCSFSAAASSKEQRSSILHRAQTILRLEDHDGSGSTEHSPEISQ